MESMSTVFIVDDDAAVRDAIALLVQSVGLRSREFASCEAFLDAYDPDACGCVLLDARLPGMSGLELLDEMSRRHLPLPVILITAHGDMPMAVRAMKSGAVDCIPKPFNDNELLECVRHALELDASRHLDRARTAEIRERYSQLSHREREVLGHVVAGRTSQEIGNILGVARKTVESHRARIMQKMAVGSLAQLVRSVLKVDAFERDFDAAQSAYSESRP